MDAVVRSPRRKLLRRVVLTLLGVVLLLVLGGAWYVRSVLTASLPRVEGAFEVEGLTQTIRIERDGRGVPTIHGQSWPDLAFGLGVVHAQDRFFQMDLLRRKAAGELAELVGPLAVGVDKQSRIHRFRSRMMDQWEKLSAAEQSAIRAYVAGVQWGSTQGLQASGAKPFEYHLLRVEPAAWEPVDCFLVVCAMYQALQMNQVTGEKTRADLAAAFPPEVARFFDRDGTPWDAPIDDSAVAIAPVPGAGQLNLRKPPRRRTLSSTEESWSGEMPVLGSNNWAVAGRRSKHGGAMVADDMHLQIQLPNIWYRVCLAWKDPDGTPRRACGVTLPGGPALVAGSNGYLAWGFTNTEGDWLDLLRVDRDPKDTTRYRGPQGWLPIKKVREEIKVKGLPSDYLEVEETVWGPLFEKDKKQRPYALRWVAQEPGAVNLKLAEMLNVRTIEEALQLTPHCGLPHQNFVCADRSGRIAWTICGMIPRRVGTVYRGAAAALERSRWDGFLSPEEYPRVIDPPQGVLWTANNRVVGGTMFDRIGNAGVDAGIRAGQIRDRLLAVEKASEADLLKVQLDDEARSYRKWQQLYLGEVSSTSQDSRRAELSRIIETWDGRAGADGAGYRVVNLFRFEVRRLIMDPVRDELNRQGVFLPGPGFLPQEEGILWAIVSARPEHLLPARFASWRELFETAADQAVRYLQAEGRPFAECSWGRANATVVKHPLGEAVPVLGRWLDMPPALLSGARMDLPRITSPGFGASERFVVSPGKEESGLFHMPGGQSGHPLSPHYRDGHNDWLQGNPSPFLPGTKVSELVLTARTR